MIKVTWKEQCNSILRAGGIEGQSILGRAPEMSVREYSR